MVNALAFETLRYLTVDYITVTKTENLFGAQKRGYNLYGHCFNFDVIASCKLHF